MCRILYGSSVHRNQIVTKKWSWWKKASKDENLLFLKLSPFGPFPPCIRYRKAVRICLGCLNSD